MQWRQTAFGTNVAMTEDREPTRIEMSAVTAQALRDRGGTLYVWAEGVGMTHARTTPPGGSTSFETYQGAGWVVQIDRELVRPPIWVIKWRRLRWPRFVALPAASSNVNLKIDAGLTGLSGIWQLLDRL